MIKGIVNFLNFINDYWTAIIVVISVIAATVNKVLSFTSKEKDEQVESAKSQIQEIILKLVSDAEEDYKNAVKSGSIKRSQVINKIYEQYPILSKVSDQDALLKSIDSMIEGALKDIVYMNSKNQSAK